MVQGAGVEDFDIAADGSVWASVGGTLKRLGADGWEAVASELGLDGRGDEGGDLRFWVDPSVDEFFRRTYEAPDAEAEILIWPAQCSFGEEPPCHPLMLVLSGAASGIGPADGTLPASSSLMDMSDSGDYWIYKSLEVPLAGSGEADSYPRTRTIDYLVHVVGGPMTIYTTDEGVPEIGVLYGWGPGWLRAGPDGSVWLTPSSETGDWCGDGVARFDGQTWARFLRGTCVYALDLGPDGTVWAQGGTQDGSEIGPVETYVITPEAVE